MATVVYLLLTKALPALTALLLTWNPAVALEKLFWVSEDVLGEISCTLLLFASAPHFESYCFVPAVFLNLSLLFTLETFLKGWWPLLIYSASRTKNENIFKFSFFNIFNFIGTI